MKKYICLLAGMALLAACEQKETTVTNPSAEKKESNTTVISQSPAPATNEKRSKRQYFAESVVVAFDSALGAATDRGRVTLCGAAV